MNRKAKGNLGEASAKEYYQGLGFILAEENFRAGRYEIDLILISPEMDLVFVEVKMRSRSDFGLPESFVSDEQRERIRNAAEEYVFQKDWIGPIRFDIACVDSVGNVEVFEDAF